MNTHLDLAKQVKAKYPQYNGIDDDTLGRKILEKYPEYSDRFSVTQPKTLQGFGENIIKSGVRAVGDIASAAANTLNPNMDQNTLVNAGKIASGIQSYTPGGFIGRKISETINPQSKQMFQEGDEAFRQVRDFYGERYGSPQKAYDTIYNDPVGVAMDVSTVAGGVGAVGGTSRVGRIANTVSRVTDPIQAVGVASKPIFKRIPTKVGTAVEEVGNSLVTGGLGQPKSLKNIEKVTGKSLPDLFEQYNLYDREAATIENVIKDVDNLYDQVARSSNQSVAVKGILSKFDEEIAKRAPDAKISEATAIELDNLKARKKAFTDLMGMREDITLEDLSQIKSAVGKDIPSSKWTMDASQTGKSNSAKATYNIYKDTINEAAPAAKQLGRDEAGLLKLKDVFENYNARGNARQNLNFSKLGSAVGGSVVAGVPGLIGGYMLESAVNSPTGIKIMSKSARKLGKGIADTGNNPIFRRTSNALSKGYKIGKAGRIVNSGNEKTTEEPTVRQQILPTNNDFKPREPIYKKKKQSIDFSLL